MIRPSLLLLLLGSILPALCRAQSEQATPPPASQPTTPAANSQTPSPAGKTEKTKKVWTNEEVGDLQGPVSVVGTKHSSDGSTTQASQNGATASRQGKIQRYRIAIAELRKKIDAADQRIARYKNFKADDSSPNGGINPNKGYSMVPLDEQVKQLEAKKKQMLASIEELENQAKKEGIEPGELR